MIDMCVWFKWKKWKALKNSEMFSPQQMELALDLRNRWNDLEAETFWKAEETVRMRTAGLTARENQVLQDLAVHRPCESATAAFQQYGTKQGWRPCLEWVEHLSQNGEPGLSNEPGDVVPLTHPTFSLCKGILLADRAERVNPWGCYCLDKNYFVLGGCPHQAAGLRNQSTCLTCATCLRCKGQQDCI